MHMPVVINVNFESFLKLYCVSKKFPPFNCQ